MPDFSKCTLVWSGGHSLEMAAARRVTPQEAEGIVRDSPEQESQKKGRWKIWGCVNGRRTYVIIRPQGNGTCTVVTVVRTKKPCT